jgi:hypothetical protein
LIENQKSEVRSKETGVRRKVITDLHGFKILEWRFEIGEIGVRRKKSFQKEKICLTGYLILVIVM